MSERAKRGCLRQGCFGCLGCGAIAIGLILLVGVIGFIARSADSRQESVGTEQVLPQPAPKPTATPPTADHAAPAVTGRIELDLTQCDFTLIPAAPGSGIKLQGDYDTTRYVIDERLEGDAETGWTYRLRVSPRGMRWTSWFRQNSAANRLRLEVPRDRVVGLSGRIAMGESKLDLGGLWLSDVDLDFGIGAHELRFDEPLIEPIDSLRVVGSLGELALHGVGNASPRRVELQHRIGAVLLDLNGAWSRDADITARCEMGECRVVVPDDVHLEIQSGQRVFIGEAEILDPAELAAPPSGAPTLRLKVTHRVGGLYVGR